MRFLFTKHETMVEISSMFPFLGNDKHILKQKKNLKCKAHFGIDQVNKKYIKEENVNEFRPRFKIIKKCIHSAYYTP